MATGILQHRRGGTASRLLVTPMAGEFFVDTDTWKVYVGDGTTAGGLPLGSEAIVTTSKTADYTILAGDDGTRFNTNGAAGNVNFTLPSSAVNFHFAFAVCEAFYLRVTADTGERIAWGPDNSSTAGFIRSNLPFSYFALECHVVGQWIISSAVGAWSLDS